MVGEAERRVLAVKGLVEAEIEEVSWTLTSCGRSRRAAFRVTSTWRWVRIRAVFRPPPILSRFGQSMLTSPTSRSALAFRLGGDGLAHLGLLVRRAQSILHESCETGHEQSAGER